MHIWCSDVSQVFIFVQYRGWRLSVFDSDTLISQQEKSLSLLESADSEQPESKQVKHILSGNILCYQ